MQALLAGAAVGASLLGLAYTFLLARGRTRPAQTPALRSAAALAAGVTALLFLLSLPGTPPWTPGLPTLGLGVLLGGALAVWALQFPATAWDEDEGTARAVGILSAAALGTSVLLLALRGYPTEALTGCALGGALAALVACARIRAATDGDIGALAACRNVEVYALANAAVALGARLGLERFQRSAHTDLAGGYWAVPGLALAVAALTLMVLAGGWSRGHGERRWWLHALGGATAAVLCIVLLRFRLPELPWLSPLLGAGFALLAAAMPANGYRDRAVNLSIGAALMALALAGLAFRDGQGYGLALAAVPAVIVAAVGYLGRQADEPLVTDALTLSMAAVPLLLAFQRVLIERVGRTIVLDYQEFYSLMAAFLGAVAGLAVLSYASRAATATRALLSLVVASAVPLAVGALWSTRAMAAFVGGTVIATLLWAVMSGGVLRDSRRIVAAAAPIPFLVGAAAVAAQFGPNVLNLDVTRGNRVIIVGVLALVVAFWVLLGGLSDEDRTQG